MTDRPRARAARCCTCPAPTSGPWRRPAPCRPTPSSSTWRTRWRPTPRSRPAQRVCAAACSDGYGRREIAIRVNGLDTEWHADDVAAAAAAGPDAVLVPKINSAADVHAVEAALEAADAPDRTAIWAMLETPIAMLHAEEIATASAAADRLRDGHQRPGQGAARRAGPGPPAPAVRPVGLPAGRAPRRQGHPRRGLQRHHRRGRLRGRVRAGPPAGLRRQDPHPSGPARGLQPGVRPEPRRARPRPGASSRPSSRPRPRAAGWSPWTDA